MSRSRYLAVFDRVRQDGTQLDLQECVLLLAQQFHFSSVYLMDSLGNLEAHTGIDTEVLPDMEEQLALELDVLQESDDEYWCTVPLHAQSQNLGTLWAVKDQPLTQADKDAVWLAGTLFSFVLLQRQQQALDQLQQRERMAVSALSSLTHAELVITQHVIRHLQERCGSYPPLPEGILIASHMADELGIARPIIVHALRKLQSSGILETRSLGVKGTWVKFTNGEFLHAIAQADASTKI